MPEPIVQHYFQSSQSFLFQWTDQGRELCWLDGTTIAFHEELTLAFERLSTGSLPGFSAVVVAMAAMRQSWPDVASRIARLVRALQTSQFPSYADAMRKHDYLIQTWAATADKLGRLSRYVADSGADAATRAELLGSLFDHLESGYSVDDQKTIAAAFREGLPDAWVAERRGDGEPMTLPATDAEEEAWRHRPPVFHRVLHDVLDLLQVARILARSLHDDPTDLKQRVHTGVAAEIVPAPDPLVDQPLTASQLLDSLVDDRELSGFARLTRHLIAVVSLPRSVSAAQDIRSGGVSDISNRGRLDKLLLSELAFDDLTLAVRIASNEAMYLRHEPPPGLEVERRSVLIDNSLPLWGIPKLYATAMALALQAGADDRLTVDCFRPCGTDVEAVTLTSRDHVAEHLASLSPTAHAGGALAAFERAIQYSAATAEPVLITSGETLASPTFRFALNQTSLLNLWIIVVDRNGRLTVLQRTRQGTSVRRSLHLPLEDILRGPVSAVRRREIPEHLPAILKMPEFPLLLSHQLRPGRVFEWQDDVVSVSDDGRMMLWEAPDRGGRQLCDGLPGRSAGDVHLVDREVSVVRFFLAGDKSELVSVQRSVPYPVVKRLPVDDGLIHDGLSNVTDVRRHDQTVLLFGFGPTKEPRCVAVDADTGHVLARETLNPSWRRNGRCICRDGRWSVLSCNGAAFDYEALPNNFQHARDVLELKTGDIVILTQRGEVIDPLDETRVFPVQQSGVPDGVSIYGYVPGSSYFCLRSESKGLLVHATSGRCLPARSGCWTGDDHEYGVAARKIRTRTPHWRFRQIAIVNPQRLCLRSSSGQTVVIEVRPRKILLQDCGPIDIEYVSFESCPAPVGVGYRLSRAEWPNGHQAWLDSRGLLHLKNSNSAYAEVTLVLRDGELSGWLSSGEVFGEDYYCGVGNTSVPANESQACRCTPEFAWETAIKPFLGSVPWTFHFTSNTADGSSITLPES